MAEEPLQLGSSHSSPHRVTFSLASCLFAGIFPLTGKLQTILMDSQLLPSASRVSFFLIPLSFSRQFLEGIKCSLNNAFCNLGIARSRSFAPVCWAALLCAVHWFRSLSCDGPTNAAEAEDGGFPAGDGGNLNKMPQGCTPRPRCVFFWGGGEWVTRAVPVLPSGGPSYL